MSKYQVPEGMLKAVLDASFGFSAWPEDSIDPGAVTHRAMMDVSLGAAIGWLAENPIVPTDEEIKSMLSGTGLHWGWDREWVSHTRDWLVEWQRILFLASEPEMIGDERLIDFCGRYQTIGEAVTEAYRRGQAGK